MFNIVCLVGFDIDTSCAGRITAGAIVGVQAKVSEREQSGRTVYRVRIGPFERKDDADKAKSRLDGNSIETALVRVQR